MLSRWKHVSLPVARRAQLLLNINHRCLRRSARVHPGAAPLLGTHHPRERTPGTGRGSARRGSEDVSCGTAEPEVPVPERRSPRRGRALPRARRPVRPPPALASLVSPSGPPGREGPKAPRLSAACGGRPGRGGACTCSQGAGATAPAGPFPDPRGGPTWALRVSGVGGGPLEAPPQGPVASERAEGVGIRSGPRPPGGGVRRGTLKAPGAGSGQLNAPREPRDSAPVCGAGQGALVGRAGGRHPTMLKRCGRRLLLALAGALLACLLVLTADPPPPPVPAERGRRALRSLAGPAGAAPAPGLEAAAAPAALAREVHSLSEYFSLLTRARRDAGPPPGGAPRPADGQPHAPAESLAPHDVFIAVKTTRKFHRARLDLLLETWISRHKEMVSPHGLAG